MLSKDVLTSDRWSLLRASAITSIRVAVTALVVIAMMIPIRRMTYSRVQDQLVLIGFLVLWTAVFLVVFRWQILRVRRARHPQAAMVEALAVIFVIFVCVFSKVYHLVSVTNPDAFTEPLDFFSSVYFSLTILATVGFGDITPVTVTARALTMLQMVLDLILLGVAVRVISGTASRTLERRRGNASDEPDESA
jgi:voltage-gated potassium channel